MAAPNVILQYWDLTSSTWVKAITHAGNSAVLVCSITKSLNNPAAAEIILSNRSKDPTATDNDARGSFSDHDGTRATLFREFQDIRILDNETGICFFRGRIYHIRNQYDFQYGNTVKLVAKDMLQELVDVPIDNAPPPLRSITLDSNANSRSKIISILVNGLSKNFITTDSTKFEASAHTFTADEMKTGDPSQSGGTYVWDIATGQQQALALINDFAKQDPHNVDTGTDHFGYDYHVDANVVSCALNNNADLGKVPFNYFKRGSRPHPTNIPDYGVTIEYPSAGWGGQTGFRKAMLPDAEFTNPNGAFFTSILAHFEDKGSTEDISNRKIHGVDNYELIRGDIPLTLAGSADNIFPWEGKRIQYIDDGDVKADNDDEDQIRINTTSGTVNGVLPGQSTNTNNPLFLFESGETLPCATVHFQSGRGVNGAGGTAPYAAKFLVLSNVYNFDTDRSQANQVAVNWTDPQGNIVRFRPFPANPANSSTVVRLHLAKGQGTTGTTYPYIIITKDARSTNKFDINKPHRVHIRDLESYDNIRRSMAGILDRSSRTSVTLGKARISRYPYTKVVAATGSSLNSRSSNTITLGTNTFKDAAGDVAGNNPTVFGAKVGMVVAQLTGANEGTSAIVRYSYISALPASNQVTYGSSATDTSDGTAFDMAKDLAFFIPIEVGHKVHLKNNLYGVDYDVIVQKISFDYSPGILTTTVEGVGVNNNTAGGVAIVPSEAINVKIVGGGDDKGYSVNIPSNSQKWKIADGTIKPYDNDHIQLESTEAGKSVTLTTLTDGKTYQIDVMDGGDAVGGYAYGRLEIGTTTGTGGGHLDYVDSNIDDEGVYVIFFRTKGSSYKNRKLQAVAVQRKFQNGSSAPRYTTGGKIYSEIASVNDIIIGTAYKDDTNGLCVLSIPEGGAFGSGWPLDLTAVGNNRMTSSLLGKGAQHWSTNIRFAGTDFNDIQWGLTTSIGSAGVVSFGDDATEAVSAGTSTGLPIGTSWVYKRVGADANATLVVTQTYSEVTRADTDRILMATVVVVADVGQESPTILPVSGNAPTMSVGAFAARSIVAGDITTDSLVGLDIQGATIHTEASLTEGVVMAASTLKIYNDGNTLGAGERLVIYDNYSTPHSRLNIRAFNTDDFGLNFVVGSGGWMTTFSGGTSDAGTSYGIFPQGQGIKAHLGYIYDGYDGALWGTENAPTAVKVHGWGGLLLAGHESGVGLSAANARYLHLLHGGKSNYKITFPEGLPADNKILKVLNYKDSDDGTDPGNATLEWAADSSGTVISVSTSGAITGGTITTTGGIGHRTSPGYKHIPTSGSSGQFLKYSSSGTAVWANDSIGAYNAPLTNVHTERLSINTLAGGTDAYINLTVGLLAENANPPTDDPVYTLAFPTVLPTNNSVVKVNSLGQLQYEENAGFILDALLRLRLDDGTAAAPSYSFDNEWNSGFYRESQYILALVANGQSQIAFDGNSGRLALRLDAHNSTTGPNSSNYPGVYYQGNRDTGFNYYNSSSYTGTQFFSDGVRIAVIGYGSANWRTYFNGGLLVSGASHVSGTFTATTKTFRIPHPLDEANKTLIHGVIEAPRYDLIYRGTATLSSGTVTASIDSASSMTSGTFVALTKNSEIWVQNKTGWTAVRGQVDGGNVIITAQDSSSTDTVAWLVMAERDDTFVKSENEMWTDNIGTFIPEWDISSLDI